MSAAVQEFIARQRELNKRRQMLHPALQRLVSWLVNLEVHGLDNVPVSGPTLIISNHISQADPVLFTAAIKTRYVVSMAKVETLDNIFQHTMLRIWGNFVVRRGEVDRAALANSIALLKANQPVWVAPEGTRNPEGMQEAKSGIAYIAQKADAIIVPAAICKAQTWAKRLLRLRKVEGLLVFGRPFRFRLPSGERLSRDIREQMIREAMYQIALTIPDEHAESRGIYRDIDRATTDYIAFL